MRRPVAAALGLVPTVLGGVRRLPGIAVSGAVKLPVRVVAGALTGLEKSRPAIDELSERGQQLVARLRDTADVAEDRVEDVVARTPARGAYDRVEDGLEDVAARARAGAAAARQRLARAPKQAEKTPEAEQPKGEPTPKATQPDATRVETAATADVVEVVEQVTEAVDVEPVTDHSQLPLADYDHMTLGSLRARLRALSVEELVQLRDYEKSKANRLPVITMLDNRIAKLAAGDAQPSGGDPTAPAPEQRDQVRGGSKVKPATKGPKINPPSQGVPTNPAQPRSTG